MKGPESPLTSEGNQLTRSPLIQDIDTAKRAAEDKNRKPLEAMYQGFFGSRENCGIFARNIPEEIYARTNPLIVDAGSSQGILGNYIREKFEQHGNLAELVMVDTNGVAMEQSPVSANKVVGNLAENPLRNESADVVILRSVLQYANDVDQVKILQEIKRILKPGGILVSQFASYESKEQADAFNELFGIVRNVTFCGKEEGIKLHESVFGEVGSVAEGPTLFETFDDFFVARIQAPEAKIAEAKKYMGDHVDELGNGLTSKQEPFAWQMPFTIVSCVKK